MTEANMQRAEWLKYMRDKSEALYDFCAPRYWTEFGSHIDPTHRAFMGRFLALVGRPGLILSAACGAGRFEGLLLEAGHHVLGIDQSARSLARAREHYPAEQFPQLRYEKIGLQEMNFAAQFDGVICMDSMEHIPPEDWPGILRGFHAALKPGAPLYLTADARDAEEIGTAYRNALAMGLPVVYGEIADQVEAAYQQAVSGGEILDQCVYHFVPPLEQVRAWFEQAGLEILAEEQEPVEGYQHILARKKRG